MCVVAISQLIILRTTRHNTVTDWRWAAFSRVTEHQLLTRRRSSIATYSVMRPDQPWLTSCTRSSPYAMFCRSSCLLSGPSARPDHRKLRDDAIMTWCADVWKHSDARLCVAELSCPCPSLWYCRLSLNGSVIHNKSTPCMNAYKKILLLAAVTGQHCGWRPLIRLACKLNALLVISKVR